MSVDVKTTCPLGSECEDVKDGFIHRCRWYVKMAGKDNEGADVDRWDCAMAWMPILSTEITGNVIRVNASIHSMRNAQDIRQEQAIDAINKKMIPVIASPLNVFLQS